MGKKFLHFDQSKLFILVKTAHKRTENENKPIKSRYLWKCAIERRTEFRPIRSLYFVLKTLSFRPIRCFCFKKTLNLQNLKRILSRFFAFRQNFSNRKMSFRLENSTWEFCSETCFTGREQDSWQNFCVELSTLFLIWFNSSASHLEQNHWTDVGTSVWFRAVSCRHCRPQASAVQSGWGTTARVISHVRRRVLCYLLRFYFPPFWSN